MSEDRLNARPLPSPPLINPCCRLGTKLGVRMSGPASSTSPWSDAANAILAFPFHIEDPTTIYKAYWLNGSSMVGNMEVAVYDKDYVKLATTGSIALSGASAPQVATLSTLRLGPGRYYCAAAHDSTGANHIQSTANNIPLLESLGFWRQASITLGSLPSPATPGPITNTRWPSYGLITRTAFDV